MVTWHMGLFACMFWGQIGVQARKQVRTKRRAGWGGSRAVLLRCSLPLGRIPVLASHRAWRCLTARLACVAPAHPCRVQGYFD